MKKAWEKRLLALMCIAAVLFTSIAWPNSTNKASAASGTAQTINDNTTSMDVDGYTLDHAYVKPGDVLKVLYSGNDSAVGIDAGGEVTDPITWTVKKVTGGAANNSVTYQTVAKKTGASLNILDSYLECLIYAEVNGVKLTIYCSELPVMYINSETAYYDITKEYTDEDTTTINLVGNDTYSDDSYWYSGTGEVKLRGNSTAYRPKRPFKIKLSEKADLLGLGTEDGKSYKSKHWVLLANDIDHSLIRNKVLYDFSGDIGTEVYFDSTNITLIYNGQYEGVYQLCEHRRVDPGRIDITDWTGIGEDAADTIGSEVADQLGLAKADKKDLIKELEEIFITDYNWMNEEEITYSGKVLADYYDVLANESVITYPDMAISGFAGAKTDWYSLTGDFSVTYEYHIEAYQYENAEYENAIIELNSGNEYLTVVCNGSAWWYGNSWRGDITNTCTDDDLSIMRDADVTVTVTREGDVVTIDGTAVGANGETATWISTAVNTSGFGNLVNLHLTGEDCTITDIRLKTTALVFDFDDYDIELPDVTGGYVAEMDFYSIGDTTLATMQTAYEQPIYFNTPEPGEDAETTAEKEAIVNSFKQTSLYDYAKRYTQAFEYAIHSDDFYFENEDTKYTTSTDWWGNRNYVTTTYTDDEHDGKHYSELFDMDSLVNNFIFCEFAMNWDSMKNSFFYYKDVDELAKIGPQWDYDWCWGNINMYNIYTNYPTAWQTTIEEFTVEQYYQTVQWNRMLIRDPYFLMLVFEKYQNVRDIIEDIVKDGGTIDTYYEYLKNAGAANDARWGYTYSTEYAGATSENFEDSIASIKKFLGTRVAWLDQQFASLDTLVDSLGYYQDYSKIDVSAKVGISKTTLTATVSDTAAKQIMFQINGTTRIKADVVNGKAVVMVDNAILNEDSLNMVVANVMNASGNYIYNTTASKTGIYNIVRSDYVAFELEPTMDKTALVSATNMPSGVRVTWESVNEAEGYYVYRKVSGGSYKCIGKVTSGNTVNYTDKTAVSGTTYIYTVRAYNGSVLGGYVAAGKSVLYLKTPALSAVTNTISGPKVTWEKITGASGYYVYRKTSSSSWKCIGKVTGNSTVTYVDKTAASGTTYTYTVRAYNDSTLSSYVATGKSTLFLAKPTVSSVTNTTTGAKVAWTKVTGANGYYVYRRTTTGSYKCIGKVTSGSTVTYTDTTAVSGTTYYYTVRAYNGSYLSSYAGKAVTYLDTPSLSSVTKTSSGVKFNWTKTSGASGYYVYRKVAGGGWKCIGKVTNGSIVTFTDTTAASGTTYYYTVRAYKGSWLSSYVNAGKKIIY
ncbi:MAG: hypothetical protein E7269_03935 [Lachnospiraceae bacterium]|nr:hypothetical protein [Lachnospiraceae bacterium]